MGASHLLVTEYENIWDPNETSRPPPSWAGGDVRVEEFMDVFLKPEFFGKLVVWNNWELRNRRRLGIARGVEFAEFTLKEAIEKRKAICKSCFSQGGLSVLCMPKRESEAEFRRRIFATGHYADGVKSVVTGDDEHLVAGLARIADKLKAIVGGDQTIFVFSHDADQLYEIRFD